MKLVVAIIQPLKLRPLQEALAHIGVERMTVCDAQGFGRQRGQTAMYRGVEYKTNLLRKVTLEIVVNDDFLDRTLDTIEA
ncbi:MAG: P-II family nitrogen regulator, partial [Pirellulaceae bacterium]